MNRFAIQVAYDGTDFCGWQTQRGLGIHKSQKPGVEGELAAAIQKLCGEEIHLVASGRTDAGVHAIWNHPIPCHQLIHLPPNWHHRCDLVDRRLLR